VDEVEAAVGAAAVGAPVAGAGVVTEAATVEIMVDAVEKAVPEELGAVTTVVLRVAMAVVRQSMHHTPNRCRGFVRYTIATLGHLPGFHWWYGKCSQIRYSY
jgi:hypothetical protein